MMSKAVDEAIELFELNRDMLGLRLELLQQETDSVRKSRGAPNVVRGFIGARYDRRLRVAIMQAALRKGEYEQAIRCLQQGEADLAVTLLRQMLDEVGQAPARSRFWRRWRPENDLLQPPRPIIGTLANGSADYYRLSDIYMNLLSAMA